MLTNIPSKKRTSESLSSSPLGSRSRLAQNTSASSNFDSAAVATKELFDAARDGQEDLVKKFIADEADVDGCKDENGSTALMLASFKGHAAIVKTLLQAGANIKSKNKDGSTALIKASVRGHVDIITLLLEAGADIDEKNNVGSTALIWASINGRANVVETLVRAGADTEAADSVFGATALIKATRSGHISVIKVLLEGGANTEAKNKEGATALMLASLKDFTAATKILLEAGANVETKNNDGTTPLAYASRDGRTTIVKLLLEAGANVEAIDELNGKTALMRASQYGRTDIVKLLLEAGADKHREDADGFTALTHAAIKGCFETIELVVQSRPREDWCLIPRIALSKGAYEIGPFIHWSSDARNSIMQWMLDFCAVKLTISADLVVELPDDCAGDVSDFLTEIMSRAEITIAMKHLSSPEAYAWVRKMITAEVIANATEELRPAVERGDLTTVEECITNGANVNTFDSEIMLTPTVLMAASKNGHTAIVKVLLKAGADKDAGFNRGITALMEASQNGHVAVVTILLEAGAKVDGGKSSRGTTELLEASKIGYTAIVKLLLEAGADRDAVDNERMTALDWAIQKRHTEVEALLRQ